MSECVNLLSIKSASVVYPVPTHMIYIVSTLSYIVQKFMDG